VRLELLEGLRRIVDESKAGALAATKLGLETEDGDLIFGGLVKLAQFLSELILGDIRSVGVEDITVFAFFIRQLLKEMVISVGARDQRTE
jgi:hypothetical protein